MADGSYWKPVWRHDCDFGHDKGQSIAEHRDSASVNGNVPLIVFIGDGISDLPAARHADVLFARKGLYLEKYCLEKKIAFIPFETFADIQTEIRRILVEDEEKTGGFGLPALFDPRAHSWRVFSSQKSAVSSGHFPNDSHVGTYIYLGVIIQHRCLYGREDALVRRFCSA